MPEYLEELCKCGHMRSSHEKCFFADDRATWSWEACRNLDPGCWCIKFEIAPHD